jgi:hypothetical protein
MFSSGSDARVCDRTKSKLPASEDVRHLTKKSGSLFLSARDLNGVVITFLWGFVVRVDPK